MPLLDTTVFIDILGRSGRSRAATALRVLSRFDPQVSPRVTTRFSAAELYVGVFLSRDPDLEVSRVDQLLRGTRMLEFDDRAARMFGSIAAMLQKSGRTVGAVDLLIASIALVHKQVLVTRNPQDFRGIPRLQVEAY